MKALKPTIGLAAACIAAAAVADGGNVVSFEKTIEAKDGAGALAGMCDVPSDAERLADARCAVMRNAKADKSVYSANTSLRGEGALAADSSMTLLKGSLEGDKTASNKVDAYERLTMPSFNENDAATAKSMALCSTGGGDNVVAAGDLPISANMAEKPAAKALGALEK